MSIGFLLIVYQIFGILIPASLSTQTTETPYPIGPLPKRRIPTYARFNPFSYNTTSSLPPLNATTNDFLKESTTYTLYSKKGLKLYNQLLSGCTPDKPEPPTFTDLLSSDFDIFPLPLSSGDRSSSALLPDILDAVGAGKGKEYFYVKVVDHGTSNSHLSLPQVPTEKKKRDKKIKKIEN